MKYAPPKDRRRKLELKDYREIIAAIQATHLGMTIRHIAKIYRIRTKYIAKISALAEAGLLNAYVEKYGYDNLFLAEQCEVCLQYFPSEQLKAHTEYWKGNCSMLRDKSFPDA
jgi:hypothetical protein